MGVVTAADVMEMAVQAGPLDNGVLATGVGVTAPAPEFAGFDGFEVGVMFGCRTAPLLALDEGLLIGPPGY